MTDDVDRLSDDSTLELFEIHIPLTAIKKTMKDVTDLRMTDESVNIVAEMVSQYIRRETIVAAILCEHRKGYTISAVDIQGARKIRMALQKYHDFFELVDMEEAIKQEREEE